MQELLNRILILNVLGTTAVFAVAAKLYLLPLLPRVDRKQILIPILLLHSLRHLGMMFLTPGAIYSGLPTQFSYPAGFGDLITALLAFSTIPLVLSASRLSVPMLWTFNVVGSIDLILAIVLATVLNAPIYMGPAYWIPAFWVPALLVTHTIVFIILTRYKSRT